MRLRADIACLGTAAVLFLGLAGCTTRAATDCGMPEPLEAMLWGQVLDLTDHPIEGAEVYATTVADGKLEAQDYADKAGCFELNVKPDTAYQVRAHDHGYMDLFWNATAGSGEAVEHTFRLARAASPQT
jgi:carboxypeptidase family protein